MKRWFPLVLLAALVSVSLQAGQAASIRADQAKAFVGQLVVVDDAVVQVSREPQSGFTYLNFGGEFPRQVFRVVVPNSVERLLDATVLRASNIRVRGIPQVGPSGLPEIVCSDPAQLAISTAGAIAPASALTPMPLVSPAPAAQPQTCTRVCRTGKACGNSCIARTATCRQPPGTACNG